MSIIRDNIEDLRVIDTNTSNIATNISNITDIDTKNTIQNKANYIASGYTSKPQEFIETDLPNTMIDPSVEPLNVGGKMVEVVGESSSPTAHDIGSSWTFLGDDTYSSDGTSSFLWLDPLGGIGTVLQIVVGITEYKTGSLEFSFSDGSHPTIKSGNGIFEFTNTVTLNKFVFLKSNALNAKVKILSVKEIQPIELPTAPFDSDSSHTTTSLSTTQAVSKGDFVVSGQELVTNGTILSNDTIALDVFSNNQKININIDVTSITSGNPRFYTNGCGDTSGHELTLGTNTFSRTIVDSSLADIVLYFYGGSTGEYDYNISVTPYYDTYQAIEDTADMYDYTQAGGIQSLTNDTVILNEDGSLNGVAGHYYKWVFGDSTHNLNTTNYSAAALWQDLGTASNMSLQNPYFQPIEDGISRQDVTVHKVDKTTLAYSKYSFKGTKKFTAEEVSLKTPVMDYYFGSSDSNGLWSDADSWYLPLGVFTRFNAGAYHPWFNEFGTAGYQYLEDKTNTVLWYSSDNLYGDSTVNSFLKRTVHTARDGSISVGEAFARPDDRFYDKVYQNQALDLRLKAYSESNLDLVDSVANGIENGSVSGVEGMIETLYLNSRQGNIYYSGSSLEVYINQPNLSLVVGDIVFLQDSENDYYIKTKITLIGQDEVGDGSPVVLDIANPLFVSGTRPTSGYINPLRTPTITKQSNNLFKSELPHTDLIGSPDNYPQSLKDRLASGKSVVGMNPLLVGQDGTDYIPDGSGSINFILSKR